MSSDNCPVCAGALQKGETTWHLVCGMCGYASATLFPTLDDAQAYDVIDADLREFGLRSLRQKNFERLFQVITSLKESEASLLEVGSAHGWFLQIAQCVYHTLGIEPEKNMVDQAVTSGLSIRHGFFPQALEPEERFDIIVFNDVFEHLPNVQEALKTCRAHLNENGILVLNLPNSNGFIYSASQVAAKFGMTSFFERMWQKDLPSPHLHYFNHTNLNMILKNFGFAEVAFGYLDILHLKGLRERIALCNNFPFPAKILAYSGALALYPLWSLAKDIMYIIAQKEEIV